MAELISGLTPCRSSILSSVWMARSSPARSEACAMRVDRSCAVSIAVIIFIRLVFWIHIYNRRSFVNRLQRWRAQPLGGGGVRTGEVNGSRT
jgi:hypothetical protein